MQADKRRAQSARVTALTTSQLRRMLQQEAGVVPDADATRDELVAMALETVVKKELNRSELNNIGPQSWRSETSEEPDSPFSRSSVPRLESNNDGAEHGELQSLVHTNATETLGDSDTNCIKLSAGLCFGLLALLLSKVVLNVSADMHGPSPVQRASKHS